MLHERINKLGSKEEILALAMFIYSIPRGLADRADALVAYSGMGEDERIIEPIKIWQSKKAPARFLLLPGHNQDEKTWVSMDKNTLSRPPYSLKNYDGVLMQTHSKNTKTQAEWVYEQAIKNNISSIAVFDTPFHLLRAYLTLLNVFLKHGKVYIIKQAGSNWVFN